MPFSEKSALNNRHRIRRMQARYEFVEKLRAEVQKRLAEIVSNSALYSALTRRLIVQVLGGVFRACSA